jgi:hypothetical protein
MEGFDENIMGYKVNIMMSVCLTNGDTHKKAWGAINH